VALLVQPSPGGLGTALLDVQRANVTQNAHALLLAGLNAVLGLLDELEQLHEEGEVVSVGDDRLQEEDQEPDVFLHPSKRKSEALTDHHHHASSVTHLDDSWNLLATSVSQSRR
jgi:hypothetical protein